MATDPHLPAVLSAAAARVDRVAEELESACIQAHLVAVRGTLGWSGPRSRIWGKAAQGASSELRTQASMARSLAGVLRRAAKGASERLYWERLAAEEARRQAERAAQARRTQR